MSTQNAEKTSPKPPRGREEVVEAIVAAAAALFASQGPAATSSREIAERAGVNYGLIHRHFGSREELTRQVMTRMAEDFRTELTEAIGAGRSPLAAANDNPAYPRALARAALDGLDLATLQHENPTIGVLLRTVAEAHGEELPAIDDRVAIALVSAAVLGWAVFGPFLRAAVGLEATDESELGERLERAFGELVS